MQKEQIIAATLDLIQEKESSSRVNLREVARVLGCAHTNLYNYFEDFDALLWAALDVAVERMVREVTTQVVDGDAAVPGLFRFFGSWIDFYLAHKGWFRLCWADPLKLPRPLASAALGQKRFGELADLFSRCIREDGGRELSGERAFSTFHTVHCYLYGEVAIFISGRGRIPEEGAFRENLLKECLNLTRVLIERQT